MLISTHRLSVFALVLAMASPLAHAESPAAHERPGAEAELAAPATDTTLSTEEQRHREGTRLVQQEGYFKSTGDRLIFHVPHSEEKYLGLENLAMERIAKVVTDRHDHSEQLLWEVTGVFTEFRGNNYLLITHAVLKPKGKVRTPAAVTGQR